MKVLELFAGSRSVGKVAKKLGFDVFSSYAMPFKNIDYVCDIFDFDVQKVTIKPDIIWASPPCTFFSVASIGTHWNEDHTPKTIEAIKGVAIVKKTLEIIKHFNPKYYYIENPRGKLRKLEVMKGIPRTSVWYCKYNDTRAKPTDIWSNNIRSLFNPDGWNPRPQCFNDNAKCHHESAPRGSKGGTQGLKDNYERSKIPKELIIEILTSST